MRERTLTLILVLLLIAASVSAPVAAAENTVIGEPDISVSSPDKNFRASDSASLTVTVANDGQIRRGGKVAYENEVQTAQSVRVDVLESEIDGPFEVNTGTQTIGSLPDGGSADLGFELDIGRATPGTYRIPVEVTYSHTRFVAYGTFEDTDRQNRERTITEYITIRVEDRPQFELSTPDQPLLSSGGTGQVELMLKNTGTETANDATVDLQTRAPGVFFGKQTSRSTSTSVFVSELEPGATEPITVQMGAIADVAADTYTVTGSVEYEDERGVTERSDQLQTGVSVQNERVFRLENVTVENFRVDEPEARLTGQLVNRGPAEARNVVLSLAESRSLTVTDGESAVGDVGVDERVPVSFTMSIPEEAEPGSISLPFSVTYENAAGDVLESSTLIRQSVTIEPERDRFEVVGTETGVTPGGSSTLDVQLRYVGDEPVSNANAKLFTSDPLSSADDGAYLGTVEPGGTTTATFRVSASGDAIAKEYASSVEIRYEEPDGDTRFTGSLSIGVPVSGDDSGGLPLSIVGIVAAIALLGGGALVYQRS